MVVWLGHPERDVNDIARNAHCRLEEGTLSPGTSPWSWVIPSCTRESVEGGHVNVSVPARCGFETSTVEEGVYRWTGTEGEIVVPGSRRSVKPAVYERHERVQETEATRMSWP